MKIGYPCVNNSIGCSTSTTFRLANYSEERQRDSVEKNLNCLQRILEYNVQMGFLFFRLSSGIVPFASHQVSTLNWEEIFADKFLEIGRYIQQHGMRISMHPDQFVVLNTPIDRILENSVRELAYQTTILDLLGLDKSAKIQIHVGGLYGDKQMAMDRFIERYHQLPDFIKFRLCIENDDRLFSLKDCRYIHDNTGIPIIFDNLHHECLNNGEPMREAVEKAAQTWAEEDGILMLDYSQQAPAERTGKHIESLESTLFDRFLEVTEGLDFDIMLEIKDKEKSARKACDLALVRNPKLMERAQEK